MGSASMSVTMTVAAVAVVVLLLAATAAAASPTITFSQCADKALCLSGCQTAVIPTKTCMATNVSASQVLTCDPLERVCGVLSQFSDPACTQVVSSQGFVSGQCVANNAHDGSLPGRIVCMAERQQYVEVQRCSPSCGSCYTIANVTAGSCVPNKNAAGVVTGYVMYDGVALCTAVQRQAWHASSSCVGTPDEAEVLPINSCIGGAKLQCNYN